MRKHRNRQVKPPTTPKREPTTLREWQRLMAKAVARAELVKDPRVTVLKNATTVGKVAQTLKRMRVICDADLLREFPDS